MKGEPRLAEGQLAEIAPKTGKRNRYYLRNSERHLLPRCPELARCPASPPPPSLNLGAPPWRPPFSSVSFEKRLYVGRETAPKDKADVSDSDCYAAPLRGCKVVLGAGAVANPARFKWIRHHNTLFAQHGYPVRATNPATASFNFGNGSVGKKHNAVDVPVAIAGLREMATTFFGRGGYATPSAGREAGLRAYFFAPCKNWCRGPAPREYRRALRLEGCRIRRWIHAGAQFVDAVHGGTRQSWRREVHRTATHASWDSFY